MSHSLSFSFVDYAVKISPTHLNVFVIIQSFVFPDRALKISSHWTCTLWVQIEPGSLVCFSFLACKQESLSRSIEEHFLPWYLRDIGCFQACEGYSVLHKESMRSRRFFSLRFYCRLAGVQRRWMWSIKHSTFSRCAPNKVMCGRADEHMGQRLAGTELCFVWGNALRLG